MSDVLLRNAAADAAALDLEGAWYAIGDGPGGGDQVSNERLQPTYDASMGSTATLSSTLSFTGPANIAVTHMLVFDSMTGGAFRFARPLAGDLSFNSSGELDLIAAPVVVS